MRPQNASNGAIYIRVILDLVLFCKPCYCPPVVEEKASQPFRLWRYASLFSSAPPPRNRQRVVLGLSGHLVYLFSRVRQSPSMGNEDDLAGPHPMKHRVADDVAAASGINGVAERLYDLLNVHAFLEKLKVDQRSAPDGHRPIRIEELLHPCRPCRPCKPPPQPHCPRRHPRPRSPPLGLAPALAAHREHR